MRLRGGVRRAIVEVVPLLPGLAWQVHFDVPVVVGPWGGDGPDQHRIAQHELVLQREQLLVRGPVEEQRADHREPLLRRLVEGGVDVRQHTVPRPNGVADQARVLLPKEPGLPPLGLQMCMAPEEGRVRRGLIPSDQQLLRRIVEEPSDVGSHEGQGTQGHGQQHRGGLLQVAPLGLVVSGPDRAVPLGPREEGPGQQEWSGRGVVWGPLAAQHLPGVRGHGLVEPVLVVHVLVGHSAVVLRVDVHGHFVGVEDGGLVHVDPRVEDGGGALVLVVLEHRGVPVPDRRVGEVQP
mmetsp:Transcript_59682/g.99008  ORF Transcript_59682/g.99008 Transcript_59682/m.99008 type:complete len:293 (+) Transcript_59682:1296-2174(+)